MNKTILVSIQGNGPSICYVSIGGWVGLENCHFFWRSVPYLCWFNTLEGGWVRKSPKLCWRNIWMIPKKLFVIRHRPQILMNSWWNMAQFLECWNFYNTNWISASALQFPIFPYSFFSSRFWCFSIINQYVRHYKSIIFK